MLAKRNKLTKTTITAICDDLAALNLIRDVGQDRDKIGRPASLLELNPQARGAIGLEMHELRRRPAYRLSRSNGVARDRGNA